MPERSDSEPTWAPRRTVTGHDATGVSTVLTEGRPLVETVIADDGVTFFEIWASTSTPAPVAAAEADPTDGPVVVPPPRDGTRIRVIEMRPGHLRDDRQSPWHRTETIDYAIMIEGELTLLLEDREVVLHAGDVAVQRGTNHAWANRSESVVRVAFVLIDGVFDPTLSELLGTDAVAESAAARSHDMGTSAS